MLFFKLFSLQTISYHLPLSWWCWWKCLFINVNRLGSRCCLYDFFRSLSQTKSKVLFCSTLHFI